MTPYWTSPDGRHVIYCGDALAVLATLPDCSVQCCVTSPPYWGLRDYGVAGQLGLESTPAEYVEKMVAVFREVRRVLRDDGTLWLNLGDSYNSIGGTVGGGKNVEARKGTLRGWQDGLKPKDLVGIPWRVAFALQADGWYLRSDIIWAKPNPMPESVTDRPTKSHEYLFLLTKSQRYYYDAAAIAEALTGNKHERTLNPNDSYGKNPNGLGNGELSVTAFGAPNPYRNRRSVWTVNTQPYPEAHFATFPEKLVEPCILAGTKPGDLVLDPFAGSGTVGVVARKHGRRFVGVELNPVYMGMAWSRLAGTQPGFGWETV